MESIGTSDFATAALEAQKKRVKEKLGFKPADIDLVDELDT